MYNLNSLIAKVYAIFLISFLAPVSHLYAQNVNYEKILDDPHVLGKLNIAITPFYLEYFNPSSVFGFKVGGSYRLTDKIGLNLAFTKPYVTKTDPAYHFNVAFVPVHNYTETTLRRTHFLEAGATYTLYDQDKQRSVKVVLSSFKSGNMQHTSFIKVPATRRVLVHARGGIYTYNSIISTDLDEKLLLKGKNDKGEVFTFGTYNFINSQNQEMIAGYDNLLDWAVNMYVPAIYAGFSRQTVTNLRIKADNYGKKGNRRNINLYADAIFAPVISMGDIKYAGVTYDVTNGDENSFRKNPLGFRIGMEALSVSKLAFGIKGEGGVRPGMKGQGAFFNIQLSFPVLNLLEKY